jgi:uncharacterized protein YigA (DUF484 family)
MNPESVAQYLIDHPDFLAEHPDAFAAMQLPQPHDGRAISLQERQVQTLRERVRQFEMRAADMVRNARENESFDARLWRWTRTLLAQRDASALPIEVIHGLTTEFAVPVSTVRLWRLPVALADAPFAQGVSDDVKLFTDSLLTPYCGPNADFEAVKWLAGEVRSVALVPLRQSNAPESFGLIVLGSPDAERYTATMGTAFLVRIGEVASAALSRCLDARA